MGGKYGEEREDQETKILQTIDDLKSMMMSVEKDVDVAIEDALARISDLEKGGKQAKRKISDLESVVEKGRRRISHLEEILKTRGAEQGTGS